MTENVALLISFAIVVKWKIYVKFKNIKIKIQNCGKKSI